MKELFFTIYNLTFTLSEISFIVCIFVLGPLLIFKRTRTVSASGLIIASYVFGFYCWLYGLIITFMTLGVFWMVVGLFFAGFGVVPLAFIGSMIRGEWTVLGMLAINVLFFFVPRFVGAYFIGKTSLQDGPM